MAVSALSFCLRDSAIALHLRHPHMVGILQSFLRPQFLSILWASKDMNLSARIIHVSARKSKRQTILCKNSQEMNSINS